MTTLILTMLLAGDLVAPAPAPAPIYGGKEVDVCAWPTTVSLAGQCTGTLIHPEVVVYASHCGDLYTEIGFGENVDAPERVVPVSHCEIHPEGGFEFGRDIAYCRLAEPVVDVPIVPVLMGCETDTLEIGRKVTMVGFGFAEDESYGIKRDVSTPVVQWFGDEIFIGGDGKDTCQGDSGGPVFVRLSSELDPGGDGTWRVFGVTSYGAPCGEGGYYTVMHKNMEWLEEASGLDLTPCHDADGTWAPSALCKDFPRASEVGGGAWDQGCAGGALGGWSATCGEPFPGTPDETPPSVAVTAPGDGSVFVAESVVPFIQVDATDAEWGLAQVRLRVNGKEVPGSEKSWPPFEYPAPKLSFGEGTYVIEAIARDLAGNEAISAPVTIQVTPEGAEGSSTDAPTSSEGSSGETGESSGSSGDATGSTGVGLDDEGLCGCRGAQGGLGVLVLLGLRRRRRAAVRVARRAVGPGGR